jgi:hypothetical protein
MGPAALTAVHAPVQRGFGRGSPLVGSVGKTGRHMKREKGNAE